MSRYFGFLSDEPQAGNILFGISVTRFLSAWKPAVKRGYVCDPIYQIKTEKKTLLLFAFVTHLFALPSPHHPHHHPPTHHPEKIEQLQGIGLKV